MSRKLPARILSSTLNMKISLALIGCFAIAAMGDDAWFRRCSVKRNVDGRECACNAVKLTLSWEGFVR